MIPSWCNVSSATMYIVQQEYNICENISTAAIYQLQQCIFCEWCMACQSGQLCLITNFSQLFCILIRIPFIRYLYAVEMSRKCQGSAKEAAGEVFEGRAWFTALLLCVSSLRCQVGYITAIVTFGKFYISKIAING